MQDSYCIASPFREKKSEFLAAVFDGHGNSAFAADHGAKNLEKYLATALQNVAIPEKTIAVKNALKRSFVRISDEALGYRGGTCALALYVAELGNLFVANSGDCTLLLAQDGKCKLLNKIHRQDNPKEEKRVLDCGGYFSGGYAWNQNGEGLMPLRSLGDAHLKSIGVIAEPECHCRKTKIPATLLLGTDGLFDFAPEARIAEILCNNDTLEKKAGDLKKLVKDHLEPDNFTFILISLT